MIFLQLLGALLVLGVALVALAGNHGVHDAPGGTTGTDGVLVSDRQPNTKSRVWSKKNLNFDAKK